ncbi:tumor protein p73-like, partial [Pipistrellus kuhlii]|uniref:tumor protein p73-like n=1 Tax=Pipistrellus kuhlii TaxID=59472 RepID=UPI001E270F2B
MSGPPARGDEGTTFQHLWSSLEPDSTYFDLPPASQGRSEGACGAEASMDFQLPGMAAPSVMVSAAVSEEGAAVSVDCPVLGACGKGNRLPAFSG